MEPTTKEAQIYATGVKHGRDNERAAVVAWLDHIAASTPSWNMFPPSALWRFADQFRAGKHLETT